ncbi:MAG: glycosyltransferase family 2 protein, partial [Candidatus Omnitrophica bacterium]|nr:glycosyltransferase family 2 protein [Candidatus Omnitrophota bacterium]
MTVSIIIAVKTWQNNLEECINKCRELDFSDFEILILPDTTPKGLSPSSLNQSQNKGTVPIRIIPTGSVSPAYKRDLALSYAKGEILAL